MGLARTAWRIDRAGSLARLALQHETLSDPGPGEARVAVKAVGLNFADIFACLGLYSATPKGPFIPGLECAGEVEALGPTLDRTGSERRTRGMAVGDRVMVLTRFGAYATAVNVDVRYLQPIPDGWSFAEAAAYPVQTLTAWYGLVRLGAVCAGDVVLVHSAAGGVGLQALAVLETIGARTIGTVGTADKERFLVERRRLDAERIIIRNPDTFEAQLDRALSSLRAGGFDVVFDAITGPYFRPAYRRLNPEGRLVVYGAADFMPGGSRPNYLRLGMKYLRRPRLDPVEMIAENRSVMAFNLIWLWDRVEELSAAYGELSRFVHTAPYVGAAYPFGKAPEAMHFLQSGTSIGKVVLT